MLAARGRRDLDGGIERIADAEERARVRRQARLVHLEALRLAAALTALATLPAALGG